MRSRSNPHCTIGVDADATNGNAKVTRRSFAAFSVLCSFATPVPAAQALQFKLPDLMTGVAGPGGVQMFGPSGELGRLSESRAQLLQLAANLESGFYKGDEDDSIVVLKISAIYIRSAVGVMDLTTSVMLEDLTGVEAEDEKRLTLAFAEAVQGLEEGCRLRDLVKQKASCAKAIDFITQYLQVAAKHYTVPEVQILRQ